MIKTLFILVNMLSASLCLAQSCPVIKGQVFDGKTGTSLPGASLRCLQHNQSGTTTDIDGTFELMLSATDTIVISYVGYESQKISTAAIDNCSLKVGLEPEARNIGEVVIHAERIIAEEFTIRKIKKLDIYTNPSAKADPILAVNATPSATTTDESANISLRGGSPAETGIFFNNVPINDAVRYSQLNGIGTFSIFNTALINSVQVYPGNPPLEFGNSTSGLIALQTDEHIPEHATNTISLTMASLGLYNSRKLTDRSSLTVFGNYQPSLLIRSLNHKSLKELKSFSSLDLGLHYFLKLKKNAVFKLFNYSLRESYQFHHVQPSYDGIFDQGKLRNFTVGNLRKRIGNTEISFNQGLSFSKADYEYGNTDINLKLHDLFSSFNVHHLGSTTEWKTGISYDHKASDFNGTYPLYDFAEGENHPVGSTQSKDHVSNPEWYGYVKRFMGKWIAGGGIRKNISIEKLKSYLSIQGNLHYKPNEHWTVNLAAGRYNKYQLPQEEQNPYLIKSNQYSLDISWMQSQSENSLSVFYKTNFINGTETNIKGIELFTRHRINNNIRFQLSLTSLEAISTRDQVKQPSPYNIHYFLRGNIEYKIQGTWTITTVFLFRQGSFYRPVTSAEYNSSVDVFEPTYSSSLERLPSYNTIDLSISKIFPLTEKSTAIAFLSVGNLMDFKNVRDYTYNFDYTQRREHLFSQRTVYFGLIINF